MDHLVPIMCLGCWHGRLAGGVVLLMLRACATAMGSAVLRLHGIASMAATEQAWGRAMAGHECQRE